MDALRMRARFWAGCASSDTDEGEGETVRAAAVDGRNADAD